MTFTFNLLIHAFLDIHLPGVMKSHLKILEIVMLPVRRLTLRCHRSMCILLNVVFSSCNTFCFGVE